MSRILLTGLLMLIAGPVLAAGWTSYSNEKFGFEALVPPGFTNEGEMDGGDGATFSGPGAVNLLVWGGPLGDSDFASDVRSRIHYLQDHGWSITYQAVRSTAASYSGTRGDNIIYAREVVGCDNTQYATFQVTYPQDEKAAMDATVTRLAGGLHQQLCPGD